MEAIFLLVFGGVIAYFAYSMIRHGGWKGAMFGARIRDTIGEVSATRGGPGSTKIKVHVLESDPDSEAHIGLELVATSFGSWSSTPIKLSRAEAQTLVSLLERAAA